MTITVYLELTPLIMGGYGTIFLKQYGRSPLKGLRPYKKGDSTSRPYKYLLTLIEVRYLISLYPVIFSYSYLAPLFSKTIFLRL